MRRIFFREVVYLDDEKYKLEIHKNKKQKLPMAVFIAPKLNIGDTKDYRQIFTDIISDRIKEKYK